jgi:hypothetical protein
VDILDKSVNRGQFNAGFAAPGSGVVSDTDNEIVVRIACPVLRSHQRGQLVDETELADF